MLFAGFPILAIQEIPRNPGIAGMKAVKSAENEGICHFHSIAAEVGTVDQIIAVHKIKVSCDLPVIGMGRGHTEENLFRLFYIGAVFQSSRSAQFFQNGVCLKGGELFCVALARVYFLNILHLCFLKGAEYGQEAPV